MTTIFDPVQLGALSLPNRIAMAPMTRSRATPEGIVQPIVADYYAQRASAGMIITEATPVSQQGSGYVLIPGMWNEAQMEAWAEVVDAVQDAGGHIVQQLFHMGRVGHSSLMGEQPVAPSAIAPEGQVMAADFSMQPYETPRALPLSEIPMIVAQFEEAAALAYEAGFDGIEIHAANGYLLDQFLRDGTNQRTDAYGGSIENRTRLLREVIEAVLPIWGEGRVGVRVSPTNSFNSMADSDPKATFTAVAEQMNQYPLAYFHVMETVIGAPEDVALRDAITASIRAVYKGNLVLNGGYLKESGNAALATKGADAIAIGVPFIANPDLVARLKADAPLAEADKSTFYGGGAEGYTDYPTLAQSQAA